MKKIFINPHRCRPAQDGALYERGGTKPSVPPSSDWGEPRSDPGQGGGMRRASGAKVSSIERLSPRLNLRRSTRMGAWNVMSLSEVRDKSTDQRDWHLSQLYADSVDCVSVLRTLRSQETWERVGQLGLIHLLLVRPSSATS